MTAMPKALPPHTPPHNVRPITGHLAIIHKSDPAADAMYEQLRSQRAWIMTTCALQRRIDALETQKSLRIKELKTALDGCKDKLGQHLTGEPYAQVADAITAVLQALEAGEHPVPEAIRDILEHIPVSRDLFLSWSATDMLKKAEAKRLQTKIDEVAHALAKLLRHGIDGKRGEQPSPQVDLPGVEPEARPRSWMDPKVQRTVYDTVAEEVRTCSASEKAAAAANDAQAAAAAAREREAHQQLLDQLKASGMLGDDMDEDEEAADQTELTLEDEPEEVDSDGIPPDAIDIDGVEEAPPPMDPGDHPALKGKIADAADKRAKNRAGKMPATNRP